MFVIKKYFNFYYLFHIIILYFLLIKQCIYLMYFTILYHININIMCIMLNVYIDFRCASFGLCSTIESYCINMVLYKSINIYTNIYIYFITPEKR